MTLDPEQLRIEGIYQQRQGGYFMHRVKVPGGVLSAEQALQVAAVAERFGRSDIHLTTRGSIELHWLEETHLAEVGRMLAAVGLTSRGACGGAVRGVVCSTPFLAGFPVAQVLARKLHLHFTHNPHFENLPKKFKIGVDAGYTGSRHLIQDIGLVLAEGPDDTACYDVWVAGGLGREPAPGFLLEERVREERIIPLIEAVLSIYRQHTPKGKRLKHLVREIGQDGLRRLLQDSLDGEPVLPLPDGFDKCLTPRDAGHPAPLEARVICGELGAGQLRGLAAIAATHAGGFLVLTCDQNVALFPLTAADTNPAAAALAAAGFSGSSREERVVFVVCPGNHECRMGLSPTRDIARAALAAMGPAGERFSWAIAGCPNSCSQPQMFDAGIVTAKLTKGAEREPRPLFDLYRRREGAAFGTPELQGVDLDGLLQAVGTFG